jgi:hypothetical protein
LHELWQERFGIKATHEHLKVLEHYVAAARECLGLARPSEHRKVQLVRGLALTWRRVTGEKPTSGRHPGGNQQTGPFAEFVRMACGALPRPFHVARLDAAIRKVCEEP